MVDADHYTINVINQCQISPPAGSVPTTNLPLTFLDLIWIDSKPLQRLFFFPFPHSTHHFMDSIFPTLKLSLSFTLKHFFPLAGNCILPPQPHNPHLLFTTHDSVLLTVAESIGCDFHHLIADYPRDAKHMYPFVVDLPKSRVLSDGTRVLPLLALKITVFPNQGLCICIAFHHVVADGMSAHHFVKSWASICRNGAASDSLNGPLPYLDRTVIEDPNGLASMFLQELSGWASSWNPDLDKPIMDLAPVNKVRATFVLSKTQIERLKNWVKTKLEEPLRLSSFIVACSLVWGCLIQSTETESNDFTVKDEICVLGFVGNCRNRLNYPIPSTYFGNCLDLCGVLFKKNDLLERNNIGVVAKAVGKAVKEFESEPLKMADEWFSFRRKYGESGRVLTVAGSPKLRVYDTNFGWGRPLKSEVLHVDMSKAISLQESRDMEGGIEIGLGLTDTHMNRFIAIWEENLNFFCS
ncbi:unnamed protein product [Citrullus colocynthis]